MEYNLDMETANADLNRLVNPSGGGGADPRLFRPKPHRDGQSYVNRVFVPLFYPHTLAGFERFPQLPFALFYLKLFGHYMEREDGNRKSTEFVLCPSEMNKYTAALAKGSAVPPMFDDHRCPSCDLARSAWDAWNDRWSELGYEQDDRRKLKSDHKEEYSRIMKDSVLDTLKRAAVARMVSERYAIPVYDTEQLPLQKGIQWFFSPESVFAGFMSLARAGVKFYSLDAHPTVSGAIDGSEILITKDTSEGVRYCKYDVRDNRSPLVLSPEVLAHIGNRSQYPSPIDLVSIWDYDRHLAFVDPDVSAKPHGVVAEPVVAAPLTPSVQHPQPSGVRAVQPQALQPQLHSVMHHRAPSIQPQALQPQALQPQALQPQVLHPQAPVSAPRPRRQW